MIRKKIIFLSIFLVGVFVLSAVDTQVQKETLLKKNIICFDKEIHIAGILDGAIFAIGGKLLVTGIIKKDIVCIGSDILIKKEAVIEGDVIVIGGEMIKETGAIVKGDYLYRKFDFSKLETTLVPFLLDSKSVFIIKVIKIFLWLFVSLIVIAAFPQKVNEAREILQNKILKIGLAGISFYIIFIILLVLFIFLSFVVLGIPFLIGLIFFYLILFIFGRTVILYFIGKKISKGIFKQEYSAIICVLLGIMVYGILKFIPVAGGLFLLVAHVFEIGIGISYILRFKLKFSSKIKNDITDNG